MTIQATYAITKAALKALTTAQRIDKYARHVDDGTGKYRWFTFVSASAVVADDINILMPDDNPDTGRWIGDQAEPSTMPLLGRIDCTTGCDAYTGAGKAFKFYAPQTSALVIVKPGFDCGIDTGADSIQIHYWTQEPNFDMIGRQFVAEMPHTGGSCIISITNSGENWISCFARTSGTFRGACCYMLGNVLVPMGFS